MLEGLEIEEININNCLNNKDFRIDSNFYTMLPYRNPNLDYRRIGDCLISSQYGMSITMNEEGIGIPIYRMNEIHDLMCDLDVNKFAVISSRELKIFKLQDRDVLFNRTNSYDWVGRTGLYFQNDDIQRVFASYLVRLIPDTSILLPEYLVTFLNSKYGMLDIKRRARQSINQTNVNPEEVKEIEIPILSKKIQQSIAEKFEIANKKRVLAKQLYEGAESRVLEALGLDDFTFNSNTTSVKTYKESFLSSGRFDAEYYQTKFDDLFELLSKYDCDTLDNLVNIKKSVEPGSDAYQDNGIPFIRVQDLSMYGILETDVYLSPKEFSNIIRPKKDTILLSKDGSVGIAYKVEEDSDYITSGAILHLSIKKETILPDYLTLVLNSKIVKMQAERDAGGSIIQHWKPSEIKEVIIPILPIEEQRKLSNKIQNSFSLRKEAKKLLEEAKQIVEENIQLQLQLQLQ